MMRRLFRTNKKKGSSATNFSIENHRMFLKELIRAFHGKRNPIIVFSAKELAKATNNYDPTLIIHKAVYYDLYKAIYEEGTTHNWMIVTARYTQNDWDKKMIINEMVVLSQINHKNIVKLLGCCLETELPILVYEHCHTNGTLSHLISSEDKPVLQLSWESRLRIAAEIADAITYLHTFTSSPVVHKDIRLGNIILDHQYVARLFGFSLCIQIPIGQTHVEEDVFAGTRGYIDPEYAASCRASEKADVYGFGIVLLQILTGKRNYDFLVRDDDIDLRGHVKYLLEQNLLGEIVDPNIIEGINTDNDPQLKAYINLALECTNWNESERPEMIQVAKGLRRIWNTVQPV